MIKFLHFENKYDQKEADYFSITGPFIWKRDRQRLIAIDLNEHLTTHVNYPIDQIEEIAYAETIHVKENGVLVCQEEGKEKNVSPAAESLLPESLKVLNAKTFHLEFSVSSKQVVRYLKEVHKQQEGSALYQDIVVDVKKQKIKFLGNNSVEKELSCEVKKIDSSAKTTITYQYELMRDLLINAEDFTDDVHFKVFHPYFSKIIFQENLFAVLMHKKD